MGWMPIFTADYKCLLVAQAVALSISMLTFWAVG